MHVDRSLARSLARLLAGKRAQCMYDHTFEEITGQYLPFKRGDVITVISEDPDGWWLGYADEQQGLFPQEYVQLLSDEIMAPVRSEVASVSSTSEPTTPRTTDASDDDDDDDLNPLHEALGEVAYRKQFPQHARARVVAAAHTHAHAIVVVSWR